MSLTETFIRKPVATVVVMASLAVFGATAYLYLPVSDLPNVTYPIITVTASYSGADPETMAATVAAPMERQFMNIPGIQTVFSKSTLGSTVCLLTFDLDKDLGDAAQDVQAALNLASSDLPDLPTQPVYSKLNPLDQPILWLAVASDTLSPSQLYTFGADHIAKRLDTVDGVAKVDIFGFKPAVRVELSPEKLAARGLNLSDVEDTITSGNVKLPAGKLEGTSRTFLMEPKGQIVTPEGYNDLILMSDNGAPVRIRDVGKAELAGQDEYFSVHIWSKGVKKSKNNIVLAVHREPGKNTVALSKAILDLMPSIEQDLPGSLDLRVLYNAAGPILDSIHDMENTLIIAFCLVVAVIFLFLGKLRETLVPVFTLPLTVLGTFIVLYVLGYSLDNLSLLALTLSIGFVVDDAIVVLENNVRHVEMGKPPLAAAVLGSREIGTTVVTMSLSLACVFLPLALLPDIVGRIFREFAVTIVVTILVSGLISLTLSPMMCARMLSVRGDKVARKGLIERTVVPFLNWLQAGYMATLKFVLRFKFLSIAAWCLCLVGTFVLLDRLPKNFIPKGDSGAIFGEFFTQQGVTPDQLLGYQKLADDILSKSPYVNMALTSVTTDGSAIFTTLVDKDKRPRITKVVSELEKSLWIIPGAFAYITNIPVMQLQFGGVSGTGDAEYSYALTAMDSTDLYPASEKLYAKLQSMKGFNNVQTSLELDTPQISISVDREKARTLQLSEEAVQYALYLALSGNRISTIQKPTDQYDVIIELEKKYRSNPENLEHIYVTPETGAGMVPLSTLATWNQTLGVNEVKHLNQLEMVQLSFNVDDSMPLSEASKALDDAARAILPDTVTGAFQGEALAFQKTEDSMLWLIAAAVVVMYIIMAILYESYLHPLTVLAALPVAGFGGLVTVWAFQENLTLYAYVGLFLLLGIVKKNGIMMIDFAVEYLKKGGRTRVEAITEACRERFRPILMTGLAAIMGAVPLVIGDPDKRSMGLIIVGGLIFSQVITLFITPVVYLYMEAFQENVLYRFSFFRPLNEQELKEIDLPD